MNDGVDFAVVLIDGEHRVFADWATKHTCTVGEKTERSYSHVHVPLAMRSFHAMTWSTQKLYRCIEVCVCVC